MMDIQNDREMIVITAWYLWWGRRKLVHEEKVKNALQISTRIRALKARFAIASSPNATMKNGGRSKTPSVFVKLNANASFDQDLLRGTMEAVLGDDKSNFIAGGNGRIDWRVDVLMDLVLALRFGLSLVQERDAIVSSLTQTI